MLPKSKRTQVEARLRFLLIISSEFINITTQKIRRIWETVSSRNNGLYDFVQNYILRVTDLQAFSKL